MYKYIYFIIVLEYFSCDLDKTFPICIGKVLSKSNLMRYPFSVER